MTSIAAIAMGIIILWVAISIIGLLWVLTSEIHRNRKEKNYSLAIFLSVVLILAIAFTIIMTGVLVGL